MIVVKPCSFAAATSSGSICPKTEMLGSSVRNISYLLRLPHTSSGEGEQWRLTLVWDKWKLEHKANK